MILRLLQSLAKECLLNPAELGAQLEHITESLFLLPFGTACTLKSVHRTVTRVFLERIVNPGFGCMMKYQISNGKTSEI